jgi:hypothetical protein
MFIRAAAATTILAATSLFVLSGTALAATPAAHPAPTSVGINMTGCGPGGCPGGHCTDGGAHPETYCGDDAPAPKPRNRNSDDN